MLPSVSSRRTSERGNAEATRTARGGLRPTSSYRARGSVHGDLRDRLRRRPARTVAFHPGRPTTIGVPRGDVQLPRALRRIRGHGDLLECEPADRAARRLVPTRGDREWIGSVRWRPRRRMLQRHRLAKLRSDVAGRTTAAVYPPVSTPSSVRSRAVLRAGPRWNPLGYVRYELHGHVLPGHVSWRCSTWVGH